MKLNATDRPGTYRPAFHLGDRFTDAKRRVFEIVETNWALPENEPNELQLKTSLELINGHRINFYGSPGDSVLKSIGLRQENKSDARLNILSVERLLEMVEIRKVVRLN